MPEEYSDRELQEALRRVAAWGKEWSGSASFHALTPEQQEQAMSVVNSVAEYMYTYHLQLPEGWDEAGLRECCLEILPRKMAAGEEYFRAVGPVLSSFLAFLEQSGRLRNGVRVAGKVAAMADQIVRNGADPRCWGMAKSFMMGAIAAGVDVTEEAELQRYALTYNQAQLLAQEAPDQRPPLAARKIGRNEPCPCGSGAKHKRCCGRAG